MTRSVAAAAIAACLALASAALAQVPANLPPAEVARLSAIVKSQHRLNGDVPLPGAAATLHLGDKYYFLAPDEARQVLKEWGNHTVPGDNLLGLILPAGKAFTDNSWGAVVMFEPAGYVADTGADKADYSQLPDLVRLGEAAANRQRQADHLPAIHLVGWAQPPSYDKARHALTWARDLKFENQRADILSYDVRLLGRRGYLSLNLVSTMGQLAAVRDDVAKLAAAVTFSPGSAYGDYEAASDKKADFGVPELVSSGLGVAVVKVGAMVLLAELAKKLLLPVLVGLAIAGVWIRHRFAARRQPPSTA